MLTRALAAVGLYGVVGYGVARRSREIGIREALGADGPRVVQLLVAGGLKRLVLVAGSGRRSLSWGPSCWAACCSRSTRSTR